MSKNAIEKYVNSVIAKITHKITITYVIIIDIKNLVISISNFLYNFAIRIANCVHSEFCIVTTIAKFTIRYRQN